MAPVLRKRTPTKAAEPVVKKVKATKRQAVEEASPASAKKQKTVIETKTTKQKKAAAAETEDAPAPAPKTTKVTKTTKKVTKTAAAKPEDAPKGVVVEEKIEEVVEEGSDSDDNDEIDAEIQALAAGLDPEDDDGRTGEGSTFEPGQDVGKIPDRLTKKEKKALAAKKNAVKEEPGVIYIGRLPHGFYEHELRGYFGQFGEVKRLRLSRNKRTGRSKHYAFIEFGHDSTAQIAAKTMDKYLLFGHILTCKVVPPENVHADLWKGANRRFKKTPWSKIIGNKLARPLTESGWEQKISKEEKRRADRAEKLKEMGYEYEAPKLKQAPPPPAPEVIEAEAEPVVAETKGENGNVEVTEVAVVEETETPKGKKVVKAKKTKKVKA